MDKLEQAARPLLNYLAAMETQPAAEIGEPDSRWVAYGRAVGGFTLGDLKRLREALAALSLSVEGVKGEPVAWRFKWRQDSPWTVTDTVPSSADIPGGPAVVEPLYAAPLASPEAEARLAQAEGGPAVTEAWLRDTAMNVMLATEVEEAIRILEAALHPQSVAGKEGKP